MKLKDNKEAETMGEFQMSEAKRCSRGITPGKGGAAFVALDGASEIELRLAFIDIMEPWLWRAVHPARVRAAADLLRCHAIWLSTELELISRQIGPLQQERDVFIGKAAQGFADGMDQAARQCDAAAGTWRTMKDAMDKDWPSAGSWLGKEIRDQAEKVRDGEVAVP